MNGVLFKWLMFGAMLLVIAVAIFLMFLVIRRRALKRAKLLECYMFLDSGDMVQFNQQIDDRKFTFKNSQGVEGTYFSDENAKRKKIRKGLLYTRITPFLTFHENVSLPFVCGLVGTQHLRKFLGSERANQMFKTKIWEEVGGIGQTNMGTFGMLAVGFTIVVIIGIVIYVVVQKKV